MEEGESPDQEWLKTPEGRDWLQSDDGMLWLSTTEGRWWSQGADAFAWYDELARDGWAAYFAGDTWPPFPGGILADDAPKIGSRVRLKNVQGPTLRGDVFREGEEAVVAQLQFNPPGNVSVELRTADGRALRTFRSDTFEMI